MALSRHLPCMAHNEKPAKSFGGFLCLILLYYLFKVFSGPHCPRSKTSSFCAYNARWSAVSHIPLLGQFVHPSFWLKNITRNLKKQPVLNIFISV